MEYENVKERPGPCGGVRYLFEDEDSLSERERLEDLSDSIFDILIGIDDLVNAKEILEKYGVLDEELVKELKQVFGRLEDACRKLDRIIEEKCKEETGDEEC
jgi:hypothetical protein